MLGDNPHDRLFKLALGHPASARAYLRSVLPADLCAELDLEHLEPEPTDLVSERLRELFADLVYKIPLRGAEAYVCALLEHQSTPEPLMPLRFLRAMVATWQDLLRREPERVRLPPIVPVLVHNGTTPWRSPVRMSELYEISPRLLAEVSARLPEFQYLLDDLRVQEEEALEARTEEPLLRLALLSLRGRGEAPPAPRLEAWNESFRALCRTGNRGAQEALVWYHMSVSGEERSAVLEAAMAAVPEIKETYVTLYERIWSEGEARGIEKGIEKGEATVLEKLLRLRFGELPAEVRARLEGAHTAELERWAERILSADTLGAVFEDRDGA